MSIVFYNENADEFYENTVNANMEETYKEFLAYLEPGDLILDLGCGSGRDSLAFVQKGFRIDAADYSVEMVKRASSLIGKEVLYLNMEELDFQNKYDGIWACASILHIERSKIPNVLERCHKALKEQGIMYLSFKRKEGEEVRGGRYFTNFTESSFKEILESLGLFKLEKIWITKDVRPERASEEWLNIILKKR